MTPATTPTLAVNGNNVGTVVFAQGNTTPTYTTTNGQPVLVTLTVPTSQDNGLADLIGYIALQ